MPPAGREYLMIFRNGLWDLPKGHREAGEDLETTALREVSEETGLPFERLTINRTQGHDGLLCVTDHCYLRGGIWHLKHTYWYAMELKESEGSSEGPNSAPASLALTPQQEEGISQAVWASTNEIAERLKNAYSSIREVFEGAPRATI